MAHNSEMQSNNISPNVRTCLSIQCLWKKDMANHLRTPEDNINARTCLLRHRVIHLNQDRIQGPCPASYRLPQYLRRKVLALPAIVTERYTTVKKQQHYLHELATTCQMNAKTCFLRHMVIHLNQDRIQGPCSASYKLTQYLRRKVIAFTAMVTERYTKVKHYSTSQLPNARWMQRLVFLNTGLSIWTRTGSKDPVLLHIDYHSTWEEKSLHFQPWWQNATPK